MLVRRERLHRTPHTGVQVQPALATVRRSRRSREPTLQAVQRAASSEQRLPRSNLATHLSVKSVVLAGMKPATAGQDNTTGADAVGAARAEDMASGACAARCCTCAHMLDASRACTALSGSLLFGAAQRQSAAALTHNNAPALTHNNALALTRNKAPGTHPQQSSLPWSSTEHRGWGPPAVSRQHSRGNSASDACSTDTVGSGLAVAGAPWRTVV